MDIQVALNVVDGSNVQWADCVVSFSSGDFRDCTSHISTATISDKAGYVPGNVSFQECELSGIYTIDVLEVLENCMSQPLIVDIHCYSCYQGSMS